MDWSNRDGEMYWAGGLEDWEGPETVSRVPMTS